MARTMLNEQEVLARITALDPSRLALCMAQDWVRPRQGENGPAFDQTDLARLRLISELTEIWDIDDNAMPLILSLLDEVVALRRRILALDGALLAQPEETCAAVIAQARARMAHAPAGADMAPSKP